MKTTRAGLILILFLIPTVSFALESGRFIRGLSYGRFLNPKLISTAAAEDGNALTVSYGYNFTDNYTLNLELSYCLDDNVLNASIPVSTVVQTCAILNINNIYRLPSFRKFNPYLSLGTALYGANALTKTSNGFSLYRSYIFADFNAGAGNKFQLSEKVNLYIDLVIHCIEHAAYYQGKIPLMLSFGFQEAF
jgi:hypothetical protein